MWGISMAGVGKKRMAVNELVEDQVQGVVVLFSFPVGRKGQEQRAATLVYLEYLRPCLIPIGRKLSVSN